MIKKIQYFHNRTGYIPESAKPEVSTRILLYRYRASDEMLWNKTTTPWNRPPPRTTYPHHPYNIRSVRIFEENTTHHPNGVREGPASIFSSRFFRLANVGFISYKVGRRAGYMYMCEFMCVCICVCYIAANEVCEMRVVRILRSRCVTFG